jgi:hypothetical protein
MTLDVIKEKYMKKIMFILILSNLMSMGVVAYASDCTGTVHVDCNESTTEAECKSNYTIASQNGDYYQCKWESDNGDEYGNCISGDKCKP